MVETIRPSPRATGAHRCTQRPSVSVAAVKFPFSRASVLIPNRGRVFGNCSPARLGRGGCGLGIARRPCVLEPLEHDCMSNVHQRSGAGPASLHFACVAAAALLRDGKKEALPSLRRREKPLRPGSLTARPAGRQSTFRARDTRAQAGDPAPGPATTPTTRIKTRTQRHLSLCFALALHPSSTFHLDSPCA